MAILRARKKIKAPEAAEVIMGENEKKLNVETITWGDFTWINIAKPTERETEYLSQNYPFHPLDLDDCLSRIQRPKKPG